MSHFNLQLSIALLETCFRLSLALAFHSQLALPTLHWTSFFFGFSCLYFFTSCILFSISFTWRLVSSNLISSHVLAWCLGFSCWPCSLAERWPSINCVTPWILYPLSHQHLTSWSCRMSHVLINHPCNLDGSLYQSAVWNVFNASIHNKTQQHFRTPTFIDDPM